MERQSTFLKQEKTQVFKKNVAYQLIGEITFRLTQLITSISVFYRCTKYNDRTFILKSTIAFLIT